MEPIRFRGPIRYWNPEKASGLAMTDVPAEHITRLGGLKQERVRGTIVGAEFSSNVMPTGGGRLALSVSKAMMSDAGVAIGSEVGVETRGVGRE